MPLGDGPLIVQSDNTVLLEVSHPDAPKARAALAPFAELERAPEHIHTYRITPLALWNARAAGFDAEQAVDTLERYSRFPVPQPLLISVAETKPRPTAMERESMSSSVAGSTASAMNASVPSEATSRCVKMSSGDS
ncbi:hypothetical protein CGOTT_03290 [Corynebacterium gottingense]|nr:hypothetical protein CGOTT_03290 [Corynebacterium gottingense]WJZ14933.1 hypothetical protein CGOTTB_03310 [Corynebacterium gottingense]WKC59586.1 hypothetical protein CHAD_03450 [Corynebacterium hadale]